MEKEEIIKKFGFDPIRVGLRHRGYWIIEKIEDEEIQGHAEIGYLCVKARDGGGNEIDTEAFKIGNCVGTAEDGFDETYRYYYYKPIES